MQRHEAILLPKVLSPDVVQIGQFLCNPLDPEHDNYVPSATSLAEIPLAEPLVEQPYHGSVGQAKGGWVQLVLSKMIGAQLSDGATYKVEITAQSKVYQSVRNANAALRTVCKESGARRWIEDLARNEKPFYFVVGMETLKEARIETSVSSQIEAHATAAAPISVNYVLPARAGTELHLGKSGFTQGCVSGVFSMKLMKAKWCWWKKKDMPTWDDKVYWKYSYEKIKGPAGEEQEFVLEVEDIGDVDELLQLHGEPDTVDAPDPDDE